jgi:class 3 adenylate cyclase
MEFFHILALLLRRLMTAIVVCIFIGFFFTTFFVIGLQAQPQAAPVLVLRANLHDTYILNSFIEILEDKTAKLTLNDVRSDHFAQNFKVFAGKSDPNFGHTTSAFWVRFTLQQPMDTGLANSSTSSIDQRIWFLEVSYPQIDNIQVFTPLYTPNGEVSYSMQQSGDRFPFSNRNVSYRMPTFHLPPLTTAPTLMYLRFESQGSLTFPLTLRNERGLSRHISGEQFVLGMFYGILAIMIGYNLFVFISLRDRSYLYYCLYIAVYGMFLFIWNGLAFQYLWADSPNWHNTSIVVFMGASGLSVFLFSQEYLQTRINTPKMHFFMNAMMLYFLVGIGLAFILKYDTAIKIMYGAPIFTMPIIISVAVICLRQGYRPARYFLIAWVLLLTTITMAALRNLNLMPSGPLTIYGLQIGSALEIFLLSLGLADRINTIKNEKKLVQEDLLKTSQALIETLQRSEQELEQKVQERTHELSEANEEISRQLEIQSEQSREIELANTALQEKNILIEQARETSQQLLRNILPESTALRLMAGEQLIADRFDSVSVMFADLVGFTALSGTTAPEELVGLLDTIFSMFDAITEEFGLEKIKTIGDCYMVVGGLPEPLPNHAERVTRAGIAMQEALERFCKDVSLNVRMRVGIHTGSVVAGVIGKKKFAYDLWGDTVNTASRMETQGVAGKVHISDEIHRTLLNREGNNRENRENRENSAPFPYASSALHFEERGNIEIKGKGTMRTWFVSVISQSA